MNAIAPHGPPIQDAPGQLPTGGGRKDDPPFGDFLAADPSTAMPPPIADHSPPPNAGEPTADEGTGEPLPPRPMRWKSGKAPAAEGQRAEAGMGIPLLPAQLDLRAVVPGITLSGDWARPTFTPENSEGGTASPGQENTGVSATQAGAGVSRSTSLVGSPLPAAAPAVLVGATSAVSADRLVGPIIDPVDSLPLGPDGEMPVQPDVQPAWMSSLKPPSAPVSETGPGAVPSNADGSVKLPPTATDPWPVKHAPVDDDKPIRVSDPAPVAGNWPVKHPPVDGSEPVPAFDPAPVANLWPVKHAPLEADESVPAFDPASAPEISSSVRIIPTDKAPPLTDTTAQPTPTVPVETPVSANDNRVELSPASPTGEAKIAAASKYAAASTREEKISRVQSTVREVLTKPEERAGTAVAREASVVTAPSPSLEDAPAPLPKRGNGVFNGSAATGRSANSLASDRETAFVAVSAPVDSGANPVQITVTPTPEPTAARHAVQVETLLKNALSAGESLRPNGHEQTEMRVRLGNGSEDVTIRLQVANDRMHVTFQTDSPEMRKALEHGWEQFSALAARSSTLALATPRFEAGPVAAANQGMQTDGQAFSFDQQNSRRQDRSDAFRDEGAPSAGSSRSAASADRTQRATTVATPGRRWTGWA